MKVTTEKPEPGVATLTIELPPEDFDRAADQAWRRVAQRVNIPGFRRGKAPRPLVERYAGPTAIDEEAVRRLLPEKYDQSVEQEGLKPIERPQFEVVQMERGQPLIFKATVALMPTVELGDYTKLDVKPDTIEVRDEEIENVLSRLRESQSQWVPVEDRAVEKGDQIIADIKMEFPDEGEGKPARSSDREEAEIVIGENGYPDGFDDELIGTRPGEAKTFTLTWPFGPAEEGKEPDTRSATFSVTVKDVKRKDLPALDDEFAKSLGEHETLDQLTLDVRRRLRDEALRAARSSTENNAVQALVDTTTFEIPARLVEAEADALAQERSRQLEDQRLTVERYLQLTGQSEEQWRTELRERAEQQLKARLVLDAVAEKEQIEASREEVQAEIDASALQYGDQAQRVRRELSREENRRRIATSLRRQKAIQLLVERAGGYPEDTTGLGETGSVGVAAGSADQTADETAVGAAGTTESAPSATGAADAADAAQPAGAPAS